MCDPTANGFLMPSPGGTPESVPPSVPIVPPAAAPPVDDAPPVEEVPPVDTAPDAPPVDDLPPVDGAPPLGEAPPSALEPLLEAPPLPFSLPPDAPGARPPEALPPEPPLGCSFELEPHPVTMHSKSPSWPSAETPDLANIPTTVPSSPRIGSPMRHVPSRCPVFLGMRLFVIGATGKTGRHIVDIALRRGHEVTAFVRSPEKVRGPRPRLTVVPGDPLNTDALAAALRGHDAVLSALGVRPPAAFRPHALVQEGMASTVAAMTRAGVSRVVVVSAAVLFPERGIVFAFFRWLLKYIASDLGASESILRATELDWTIARPPRLRESAGEAYRARAGVLPERAATMSFSAVAAFMLDVVEERRYLHEIVGLAQ